MQNNKDNSNQSKHSFKKDNQMEKQGVQEIYNVQNKRDILIFFENYISYFHPVEKKPLQKLDDVPFHSSCRITITANVS